MAKEDEGMSLFPEIFTSTRKLSDEQFGALIRAGRVYQTDGIAYQGDDIAVDIAFQFLANQIDRRSEASTKKTAAAKRRWEKKDGCKAMQSDAEACTAMQDECKAMQSDAEACTAMQDECKPMQSDAPIHSIPIHSIPIHSKESKADKPPAPTRQTRKPHGEYGWVKLTDDEFNRLLNDLGEVEVKRCIAYVDESAQSTGNKNKWRDWNLVIRKCSKQGWGQSQGKQGAKTNNGPRQLDNDEVAAIRRMMEEPL